MENVHNFHHCEQKTPMQNSHVPQSNLVYVNKNMMQSSVIVNPKFNHQVHVNPNFASKSNKVYVNPNVFKKTRQSTVQNAYSTNSSIIVNSNLIANSKYANQTTNAKSFVTQYSKINNIPRKLQSATYNVPVVKTKTKLIRIPTTQSKQEKNIPSKTLFAPHKSPNRVLQKTRKFVSRHKLIKLVHSPSNLFKTSSFLRPKMQTSPNRFKLDNRRQSIIKSPNKLRQKAYMMRLDPQNTIIKKTTFKLVRNRKITSPKVATRKTNTKRTALKLRKSLKKNNIPCELYNRRGFCKLHTCGKCPKKHDPNQIQICIWFLQGLCLNTKCRLSHKVSLAKMPTCKFFLEGMCHKEDCPYSHVKLSKDAPICREFLNGFCSKGRECDKRHQFLCPDFERDGNCKKKLCRYPHGKAVRPFNKRLRLSVTARHRKSKVSGMEEVNRKRVVELENVVEDERTVEDDAKRYYDCGVPVDERKDADDEESCERPKLGTLPSFISI